MTRARFAKPKLFKSEAHLCETLSTVARVRGFRVYAETADFDLLLVATKDAPGFDEGTQIGVEAKLLPNVKVLAQAMRRDRSTGPHHYAVLVPEASGEFMEVARALHITVLEGSALDNDRYDLSFCHWYDAKHAKPCWVPGVEVPDLRGGHGAPERLTPWKLDAVRLCLLAEERGYLVKADFQAAKISMGRFLSFKWMVRAEVVKIDQRREYRYRLLVENKPPHLRYPEVAAAIRRTALS